MLTTESKYGKTHWVNPSRGEKMPVKGEMCYDCQAAPLKEHSFRSKKTGKTYTGVACPNCQSSWMVSQYEDKPKQQPLHPANTMLIELLQDGLKGINDRLDAIEEYLSKKKGL